LTKPRTLKSVIAELSPARRKRVVERAAALSRNYHALRELRKARAKTQTEIAETLAVTQPYVAKLERRSDLMLSVLRKYVRSVGGELELVVTFPETGRFILSGIGEAEQADPAPTQAARKKR
jgi:transcriptional regulator with XRE-family HTH domain